MTQWLNSHCGYPVPLDMSAPPFIHPPANPYVLIFYFLPLFWRSVFPCRRKFPGFHLFTWERLPQKLRGRLHHPVCSWDPNNDSLSKLSSPLSLPEPTNISHSSSSSPLVREPLLSSQWVTNGFTNIEGLCGCMVPPVLNCRYCNHESHPASFKE